MSLLHSATWGFVGGRGHSIYVITSLSHFGFVCQGEGALVLKQIKVSDFLTKCHCGRHDTRFGTFEDCNLAHAI